MDRELWGSILSCSSCWGLMGGIVLLIYWLVHWASKGEKEIFFFVASIFGCGWINLLVLKIWYSALIHLTWRREGVLVDATVGLTSQRRCRRWDLDVEFATADHHRYEKKFLPANPRQYNGQDDVVTIKYLAFGDNFLKVNFPDHWFCCSHDTPLGALILCLWTVLLVLFSNNIANRRDFWQSIALLPLWIFPFVIMALRLSRKKHAVDTFFFHKLDIFEQFISYRDERNNTNGQLVPAVPPTNPDEEEAKTPGRRGGGVPLDIEAAFPSAA